MQLIFTFILFFTSLWYPADPPVINEEYAEIHVFRPKQYQGGAIVFQVQVNDETVARLSNGSRIIYRVYNEGSIDVRLKASVFTSKAVNFGIVKGEKYYIKAGYTDGFGSKLSFLPLAENEGQKAFNDLDNFHSKKIKVFEEDINNSVVRGLDIFSEEIETFEEVLGEKPSLAWLSPKHTNETTSISTYSLQLCMKSSAEQFKMEVWLNNELLDALSNISVIDKKCSFTYIKNLELSEGKNTISVTIIDKNGEEKFSRSVTYKEKKKEYRGLALVIGNADYLKTEDLMNPINDANEMARAFNKLGFEVLHFENLSQEEMKQALGNFALKLSNYKTGIFYYAGHGLQYNGRNYLVPVDVNISSYDEVVNKCFDTGELLTKMELMELETSILILDACRNNPFKGIISGSGDLSGGLTGTDAPAGSIVAFATAPGKTASDGTGRNGLYTQEILNNIYKENLKVEDLFKRVRVNVMTKSNNRQIPWETSSLIKDFYFNPEAI